MLKNNLTFKVKVVGVAPLLFNRFPDEANPDGKDKKKTAVPSKDEQVTQSLYKLPNGKLYQPAEHFVGAMIKAASSFKLAGKKTFKDVAKAGIFVEPLKIPHLKQPYVADWRGVVIPSTRGRVMKGRGRMDEWAVEFTLQCIDDRANEKDIKDILTYAGAYVGVGDYRPRYGRFEISEWKKM